MFGVSLHGRGFKVVENYDPVGKGLVGVEAKPSGWHSAEILGRSWPSADEDEIDEVAAAEVTAAAKIDDLAHETATARDRMQTVMAGHFAGATYAVYTHAVEQQREHSNYLKNVSALRKQVANDVAEAKRLMAAEDRRRSTSWSGLAR